MIMAGRGKHLADVKNEVKKVGIPQLSSENSTVDLQLLVRKINEINASNPNSLLLDSIQSIIKQLCTTLKVMKGILSDLHSKALCDAEFGEKLVLALEKVLYLQVDGTSLRNELLPFFQNDFEVREMMFKSDRNTFINSVLLLGNAYNVFKMSGKPIKIFGSALLDYFDLLITGGEKELKTLTKQILMNGINLKKQEKYELLMGNLRNTLVTKSLNLPSKCWILLAIDFISNDLKPLKGVIKDFYVNHLGEEYIKLGTLIPLDNDQDSFSPDSSKSQDISSPVNNSVSSIKSKPDSFKKDLSSKIFDMNIKSEYENKDKIQSRPGKKNKKDFWKSSGSSRTSSEHDDRFEREENYYGSQKPRKPNPENQRKKFNENKSSMKGVDKQDQLLACFPVMRKCVKGYKKMAFYLIDMAIFNSHVLYNKVNCKSKTGIVQFRLKLAEELLEQVVLPNYSTRGRPSSANTPQRLQANNWAHFPENIPATESKEHPTKRCRVCYKHKIREETTWQCKLCQVPLHLPTCFEKYHTVQNY